LVVALVPVTPRDADDEPATSVSGLRYLRSDRPLRRQLGAVMIAGIGWTALMAILPVAARRRYHGGGQLAGALVAAYGGGSVLGAVVVARTKRAVVRRPGLPLLAIAVAMAVAVVRLPAWGLAIVVAAFGVGNGIYFPRLFAALTLRPPQGLRTSVMATAQVAMSVTSPVGFLVGGLLLEHASISVAFVLVAVTATIAAALSLTGQPLGTGIDVEGDSANEPDEGEPGLLGELHRE
jgi:predicted MFS family arabinose efflux permease